jgi:hypothetical protein
MRGKPWGSAAFKMFQHLTNKSVDNHDKKLSVASMGARNCGAPPHSQHFIDGKSEEIPGSSGVNVNPISISMDLIIIIADTAGGAKKIQKKCQKQMTPLANQNSKFEPNRNRE